MKDFTYVIIGGYFYSGSSAVTDLLKEYANVFSCGSEIRLINDPYGLIALEDNIVEKWDWIRAAMALDDFWEFSKQCARKKSRFPLAPFGMGYKNINSNYLEITKNFVSRLIEFTYDGDFYAYQAKEKYINYVLNRCRLGIEIYSGKRLPIHKRRIVGHSHPTKEQFEELVKDYFDKLFEHIKNDIKTKYVVLDQAVHPRDLNVIGRYFRKSKMIIVDRDPRDMFIQSIISGAMEYSNTEQSGWNFISMQKALHEGAEVHSDNVLYINFEDLVQDYNNIVSSIETFLDLDINEHKQIKKYFNPEISTGNIGIWKKYNKQYGIALNIISDYMNSMQ